MGLAKQTLARIQGIAARYPSKQSAIIPALWAAQDEQGYVTQEAMNDIARELELPASLIEATASFYSMFLNRPEGRHDVVICINAPCFLRGADEMAAYLERALGVRDGETTPDGAITWHSTIECLGACGGGPMMQVDHRFEENLTPERIDIIIDRLRKEPAAHGVSPPEAAGSVQVAPPRETEPTVAPSEPVKRKTAAPRRKKAES
jgi:NADH-quinone oxidoreductase subunit E